MSYILDALKRSDQDRKQGDVPNIRSQSENPVFAARTPPDAQRKKYLLWSLALLAGVLLIWFISRATNPVDGEPPTPEVAALPEKDRPVDEGSIAESEVSPPQPISSADEFLDAVKDVQIDVSLGDEPDVDPSESSLSQPLAAQSPASPDPVTREPEVAAEPAGVADESAPAGSQSTDSTVASDPDPGPYDGIPHQRQLDYELQSALPAMTVSVHMYSANPSLRLVRINNTIYREGDLIDSDLKLEEITQDGLILSIRDTRFWRYAR
jgi:general secretion pathway protein B